MRFGYQPVAVLADAVASGARHTSHRGAVSGVDFIAGGTDLLQLLQEHVCDSALVVDITRLPGLDAIHVGPVRCAAGGVGADGHGRSPPGHSQALPGRDAGAAGQRVAAGTQSRDAGRQPAAADPLRLFPGSRRPVQQTRTGKRLPRDRRSQSDARGARRQRALHCHLRQRPRQRVARPRRDPAHRRSSDGTRTIALADLHQQPGATPHVETQLQPG